MAKQSAGWVSGEGTQGGYNRGAWCTDLQSVSCGINGRADSKGETGAQGGGWKDEPLPLKFTNTEVDDKTSRLKIPLHLGSVREQESLRAWGHKPRTNGRLSKVIQSAPAQSAAAVQRCTPETAPETTGCHLRQCQMETGKEK